MRSKILFNYRILKLFLKTYGKDEIDNKWFQAIIIKLEKTI